MKIDRKVKIEIENLIYFLNHLNAVNIVKVAFSGHYLPFSLKYRGREN